MDKHLRDEAAEYQRVMREIEEQLGVQGTPLDVDSLVERWLHPGDVVKGAIEAMRKLSQVKAAALRQQVRDSFKKLKNKIAGSIDDEIAIIYQQEHTFSSGCGDLRERLPKLAPP